MLIDVDWCWLMLIDADWQLMLIDSDWWKLILIEEKNLRAYPWVKIGLKVLLCVKKLTWYSNWHFTTGTQWCQTKYTLSKHQCQNFPKDLLINSLKIWHFFLEKLSISIREVKEKRPDCRLSTCTRTRCTKKAKE